MNTWGFPCRSIEFFLCAALSSPVLYTANSSCFGLPRIPVPCSMSSTKGGLSVPPGFHLLSLWPGIFPCVASSDSCRAHLVSLAFLRHHCPSLPDVQCFENHCFIYFVQFFSCTVFLLARVIYGPCYSIFSESGSPAFS